MSELKDSLDALEAEIAATEPGLRHVFQARLHKLIEELKQNGEEVSLRMLELDEELTNDAIEAQFDNMPV